jgi:hypothetical protein
MKKKAMTKSMRAQLQNRAIKVHGLSRSSARSLSDENLERYRASPDELAKERVYGDFSSEDFKEWEEITQRSYLDRLKHEFIPSKPNKK